MTGRCAGWPNEPRGGIRILRTGRRFTDSRRAARGLRRGRGHPRPRAAGVCGGGAQASFGEEYLHEDLSHMAAAYAFHIAQNQPFLDGNKRTGLVAALVFLDLNGIIVLDPKERLYIAMIAIAERRMDKQGLAELLRELSVPS